MADFDEFGFPVPFNDPDYCESEWDRMKPPFRIGVDHLRNLVRKHGNIGRDHPLWTLESARWVETGEGDGTVDPIPPEPSARYDKLVVGDFGQATSKYKLKTISDIMKIKDPEYLIFRHVPERGVGIIYGPPGTFKSFLTLDMSLSISYDFSSWHGDRIETRGEKFWTLYLAGEGASGFKARISSWLKVRGLSDAPEGRFWLLDQSVNFLDVTQVAAVIQEVKAQNGCRVGLIVVDTVSRVIPGADENSQAEMTLFIAACERLRDAFDCAVLGVHHTNKAVFIRGSTVFTGNIDFVFEVTRAGKSPVARLFCEKQKDAPDKWHNHYSLNWTDLGNGRSSLVPKRCEIAPAAPEVTTLKPATRALLTLFEGLAVADGTVPVKKLREQFRAQYLAENSGTLASSANDQFRRLAKELIAERYIVVVDRIGGKHWMAPAKLDLTEDAGEVGHGQ